MVVRNPKEALQIKLLGSPIEHLGQYKCLYIQDNIFNTIRVPMGDMFKQNHMNTYVTAPVAPYSVCWSACEMLHHYHPSVYKE